VNTDDNGFPVKRYQVQTRSGADWSHYAAYDEQSAAFRCYRSARRTGYSVRVVDTRSDKIVQVPR